MTDNDQKTSDRNESDDINEKSRRKVIKKTVLVGGMTLAVAKWSKPVIEDVILPAHAQTSVTLTAAIVV